MHVRSGSASQRFQQSYGSPRGGSAGHGGSAFANLVTTRAVTWLQRLEVWAGWFVVHVLLIAWWNGLQARAVKHVLRTSSVQTDLFLELIGPFVHFIFSLVRCRTIEPRRLALAVSVAIAHVVLKVLVPDPAPWLPPFAGFCYRASVGAAIAAIIHT